MYFRMNKGIYLRCNGELACYCGPGEEVVLGKLPLDGAPFDFIDDFYNNQKHRHVIQSMKDMVLPYPNVCLKCIYLEPFSPPGGDERGEEIEWMHMEATSQCNLNCHFCIPSEDRKKYREPPYFLPLEIYEKIIDDIAAHKMAVKWMYFSGRGEPGLHKDLWKMVKIAKEKLGTNFLVNTNGNIPYSEEIIVSGLDKIKIAIDGVTQESYGAYRRGGKLKKVLELTRKISEAKAAAGVLFPKIIWQYILFSHNDSQEEMKRIQEMALENGVDEILFKTTFTDSFSAVALDSIPVIHHSVRFLDIRKMVSVTEEEINNSIINLEKFVDDVKFEDAIPCGIDISKKIFRSFILGIEKKQQYNAYGQKNNVASFFGMARQLGDDSQRLLNSLSRCFLLLDKSYRALGKDRDAQYFKKLATEINQQSY